MIGCSSVVSDRRNEAEHEPEGISSLDLDFLFLLQGQYRGVTAHQQQRGGNVDDAQRTLNFERAQPCTQGRLAGNKVALGLSRPA